MNDIKKVSMAVEASTKMVADQIESESHGPWSVQEGTDTEAHVDLGTFESAADAVALARKTAAASTKFCFVLDRDGYPVMTYNPQA